MRRSLQPVQDRDTSFSWESIDSQVICQIMMMLLMLMMLIIIMRMLIIMMMMLMMMNDADAAGGFETLFT